ncbi:SprT family protein [Heyndrickxia ginsengihumi]|uniref:SprT family protein n=1 Tax=Heyndrickxia ginsengihumi TaxID=363870 RepID=UPI00203C4766|nr:SprT family protein [Heyndrickxia ginsengihumi]MCM3024802.1 SprT family protein [Heyndrickxia ginsengihumi]
MNNVQLQKLVEEISLQYFQKPFLHTAIFNPRLRTTGGRYLLNSHHIEINKKYLDELGEAELIGIIKHELCHYHLHINGKGYQHRDQDFKLLLQKVDAPRYCSSLPSRKDAKSGKMYEYICSQCGIVYRRRKKVDVKRYVCGKCKGKLVLSGKGNH